jgi:hypothetical protein
MFLAPVLSHIDSLNHTTELVDCSHLAYNGRDWIRRQSMKQSTNFVGGFHQLRWWDSRAAPAAAFRRSINEPPTPLVDLAGDSRLGSCAQGAH